MNVDVCTSLPITTAMSRLDLRIGVSPPGPLRRAGLPRPEPDASGTGRGGASAAALIFVRPEAGALVFPGAKGGPMRRSNFNKTSAWPHAVQSIEAEGLHVHDLRHTGNSFAEMSGVASDTSFDGTGGRALPAVQRAAPGQPLGHESPSTMPELGCHHAVATGQTMMQPVQLQAAPE